MDFKIVLSDGRTLTQREITKLNVHSLVNNGTDVRLGSACMDAMDLKIWDVKNLAPGTLLSLYRVTPEEDIPFGVFVAEKPVQAGRRTYALASYDKMSRFESDATDWLRYEAFPNSETYSLLLFARMLAAKRGIELGDVSGLLNSDFIVHPFLVEGCTFRQIVGWIAEVGGCYAHMDKTGRLGFCWYRDSNAVIAPYESSITIGASKISHDDYTVATIGSVRIETVEHRITAGPDKNAYSIRDNPILGPAGEDELRNVATRIYDRLKYLTYTPGSLSVKAGSDVWAGDFITYVDNVGVEHHMPIMDAVWEAGKAYQLSATGNKQKDSATAVAAEYKETYSKTEAALKIAQELNTAKKELQDLFHGVNGGSKVEHTDAAGNVYEVLFLDTMDEASAKNVLCINNSGISFSNTGVAGEYTQALSIDGGLANEWISTWQLNANIIVAGILQSADGSTFYLDLEKGILRMDATELSIGGKKVATEKYTTDKINNQTQEDIFNKLTNGGAAQGLYIENGKLYLNLEYAKAGKIAAERIDVTNLLINRLFSKQGSKDSYVEMLNNGLNFYLGGALSIGLGYYSSNVPMPYLIFGAGVSPTSDTAGMIKMYPTGIWIGDSQDRECDQVTNGTGLFVDTKNIAIYKVVRGEHSLIADDTNVIAIFG